LTALPSLTALPGGRTRVAPRATTGGTTAADGSA